MPTVVSEGFEYAFNAITPQLRFKQTWRTADGFLDPEIVTTLGPGEIAKSEDPVTGERVIFLGTRLGTVKLYQTSDGVFSTACFVLRVIMSFGEVNSFNELMRFINPVGATNRVSAEVDRRFRSIKAVDPLTLHVTKSPINLPIAA